jgi:hypothetical protein
MARHPDAMPELREAATQKYRIFFWLPHDRSLS